MHNAYSIVFIILAAVFWLVGLAACLQYEKRLKSYKIACRPYEKIRYNCIQHSREPKSVQLKNAYRQISANCGKQDGSEYELAQYLSTLETGPRINGKNLSIVGRRLLHIVSMVHEKNAAPSMPDLETLSHLTRNRERSGWEFASIGISASSLLVIGLCGTLWCISDELQHSGENLLPVLANSLWPSMLSVTGYVVLIIWRVCLSARFETALMKLNNLTLSLFEPVFQPLTHIGQAQKEFEAMLNECQLTPQQLERDWQKNALETVFNHTQEMVRFYCESIATYLKALPDVQKMMQQLYEQQRRLADFNNRLVRYRHGAVSLIQRNVGVLTDFAAQISQLSTEANRLRRMVPTDIRGEEAATALETKALQSLQRIGNLHGVCNSLQELIKSFTQAQDTLEACYTRLRQVRHRRVDIETDMQAQVTELAQMSERLSAAAERCRQSMEQAQQQTEPFIQASHDTLKTIRWKHEQTKKLTALHSQQFEPNFRQLRNDWNHLATKLNNNVYAPTAKTGCLALILESLISPYFAATLAAAIALACFSAWWRADTEPPQAQPAQTTAHKGANARHRATDSGKERASSSHSAKAKKTDKNNH